MPAVQSTSLSSRLTLAFVGVAVAAVALLALLTLGVARGGVSRLVEKQRAATADAVAVALGQAYEEAGSWQAADLTPAQALAAAASATLEIRTAEGRQVSDGSLAMTNMMTRMHGPGMGMGALARGHDVPVTAGDTQVGTATLRHRSRWHVSWENSSARWPNLVSMSTRTPRIVSLLPSATEIVCALGLEASLVGVTHECDYPPSVVGKPQVTASRIPHQTMTSAEIDHAVRSQLDGHGSIYDLDEAQLRALEPDLILTQELCEVCAVSYKTVEQAARMLSTGVNVVSLEPNRIADILANVRTVGRLTGTTARAKALVAELATRLDTLTLSLVDVKRRPRTLVLEWLEPPFAPGHWVPEQVALAGGDQTFGSAGAPSRTTNAAQIRAYCPDVIVLAPCGYYAEDTLRELPRARLPEGWHELPAVREGNVWAVDATSYFSRPGPRVVDGAEILARIIHPQLFGAPDEHMAVRVPPELMKGG